MKLEGISKNFRRNAIKIAIYFLVIGLCSLNFQDIFSLQNFVHHAHAATTRYVSTTGSDAVGDGSEGNPWATLDWALSGSRTNRGDTVIVKAGTYDAYNGAHVFIQPVFGGAGDDPVTIQGDSGGARPTLNIPNAALTGFFYLKSGSWTKIHFKNLNFTNTHTKNTMLAWVYGHELTFENTFTNMNSSGQCVVTLGNDAITGKVTFLRSTIINTGNLYSTIRSNRTDDIIPEVIFIDSLYYGTSTRGQVIENIGATNLTLINNTFSTYQYSVSFQNVGGTVKAKNNIFYGGNSPWRFITGSLGMTDFTNNPARWDVTNNIWYNPVSTYGMISNSSANPKYLMRVDNSNHWLNPSFTNSSGGDYSIASGSIICGLGLNSVLPSGGDINLAAWTGNDIGAYKCPSATNQRGTLLDKVAFSGDSIMLANGLNPSAYTTFNSLTGIDYVPASGAALSGADMQTISALVDQMITTYLPDTVFLSVGINNLAATTLAATDQQFADYLISMMQKIANWGARPIWLGIGSANGYVGINDDHINNVNSLVANGCNTRGWSYANYLDQFKLNPHWQSSSPAGYYDTAGDVHPNSAGQAVIGQVADYLYYSHRNMGENKVDIGAGARIYSDGRFRNLGTPSGQMADFYLLPQDGIYSGGNLAPLLDIHINTWENNFINHKNWTETSFISNYYTLNNTVHIIGDLLPNTYYTVKVDGLSSATISGSDCPEAGLCFSNSAGKITFTYSGGYSTHTFDIAQWISELPATGAN